LELLAEAGLAKDGEIRELIKEADEFVAIFTASRKTATGKI
jgi:hypothetical protein